MSSTLLQTARLRVEFVQRGDRWLHQVSLVEQPDLAPLLVSREGSGEQPWPESPPFQSLNIEGRYGAPAVALLTGMAGSSHWSGSIEAHRGRDKLVFDLACRLRSPSAWLGSRYEIRGGVLAAIAQGAVVLDAGGGLRCQLSGDRAGGAIVAGSPAIQGRELSIRAPQAAIELPATVRWRYELELIQG